MKPNRSSLVTAIIASLHCAAAQPAIVGELPRNWADEPLLPQVSAARAAEFLDKYARYREAAMGRGQP